MYLLNQYFNQAANALIIVFEEQSLWYARNMIDQSISNVKLLEKGEEQIIKLVSDSEVSALKEHYDITFHKTLAKVQVPEKNEK